MHRVENTPTPTSMLRHLILPTSLLLLCQLIPANAGNLANDEDLLLHLPLNGTTDDTSKSKRRITATNITFGSGPNNDTDGAAVYDGRTSSIMFTPNLPDLHQMTLCAWVKLNNTAGIVHIFADFSLENHNDVGMHIEDGKFRLTADKGPNAKLKNWYSKKAIEEDKWYHLAWVMEPQEFRLYVNGNMIARESETCSNVGYKQFSRIGVGATRGQHMLNGSLCDFRIYGRALSEREIKGIHSHIHSPPRDEEVDPLHMPGNQEKTDNHSGIGAPDNNRNSVNPHSEKKEILGPGFPMLGDSLRVADQRYGQPYTANEHVRAYAKDGHALACFFDGGEIGHILYCKPNITRDNLAGHRGMGVLHGVATASHELTAEDINAFLLQYAPIDEWEIPQGYPKIDRRDAPSVFAGERNTFVEQVDMLIHKRKGIFAKVTTNKVNDKVNKCTLYITTNPGSYSNHPGVDHLLDSGRLPVTEEAMENLNKPLSDKKFLAQINKLKEDLRLNPNAINPYLEEIDREGENPFDPFPPTRNKHKELNFRASKVGRGAAHETRDNLLKILDKLNANLEERDMLPVTSNQFIQILKQGIPMKLMLTEYKDCNRCLGDGKLGVLSGYRGCPDCGGRWSRGDGKIKRDIYYSVTWK